ncbi:hypothetical protein NKH18_22165 [Streptomyces sp. M10(2022)]
MDGVTSMIHGFLLGVSVQVCDGTPARDLHAGADVVLANWNGRGRTPRQGHRGVRPSAATRATGSGEARLER